LVKDNIVTWQNSCMRRKRDFGFFKDKSNYSSIVIIIGRVEVYCRGIYLENKEIGFQIMPF